ncbi:MAG TPA: adenosylcobinamide-phosphate synthase CbiB [Dehalococcoidia bacterium]|nr:adenosylcobinamide-phosphate synthase CbiB [Dehalococcoidia bacterium]
MRRLTVFVLALLLDVLLGEPPERVHPTAWTGRAAQALEALGRRLSPRWQLLFGGAVALLLPLAAAAAGRRALRRAALTGWAGVLAEAALLKSTFAVRALLAEALALRRLLEDGDLEGARRRARALVGRDTSRLGSAQLVSAGLESLAENSTDAFVAPWLYYVVAGTEGALAYRAINTLDAMWGYHGEYEHLGKAAARLDDLANLLPARLSALLLALASGRPRPALTVALAHHSRTESPNAGWTMSALAGALGVELEKVGHYRLGEARRPLAPPLLREGVGVVTRTAALGAALVSLLLLLEARGWRR